MKPKNIKNDLAVNLHTKIYNKNNKLESSITNLKILSVTWKALESFNKIPCNVNIYDLIKTQVSKDTTNINNCGII
jgi:hypothetical protein